MYLIIIRKFGEYCANKEKLHPALFVTARSGSSPAAFPNPLPKGEIKIPESPFSFLFFKNFIEWKSQNRQFENSQWNWIKIFIWSQKVQGKKKKKGSNLKEDVYLDGENTVKEEKKKEGGIESNRWWAFFVFFPLFLSFSNQTRRNFNSIGVELRKWWVMDPL